MSKERLDVRCKECKSPDVRGEAAIFWSISKQDWLTDDLEGTYCADCGAKDCAEFFNFNENRDS